MIATAIHAGLSTTTCFCPAPGGSKPTKRAAPVNQATKGKATTGAGHKAVAVHSAADGGWVSVRRNRLQPNEVARPVFADAFAHRQHQRGRRIGIGG